MRQLVFINHNQNTLQSGILNILSAPITLGDIVDAIVLGYNCQTVVDIIKIIPGITNVIVCDTPHFEQLIAENCAAQLKTIACDYSHIWFNADTTGKNIAPRLSALLDIQQISEIIAVKDAQTFIRPIYTGNAIATIKSNQKQNVITVRSTAFPQVAKAGGNAKIVTLSDVDSVVSKRHINIKNNKVNAHKLTSAKVVISGGRGIQSKENFLLLKKIAAKLGAAVGASRAAVDAGFITNDYQIGQTGKIIAPDLYIAVGISGAIQHLAGIKDSKYIVAINKDENAPIFQVADYALVADSFTALFELDQAL